MINSILDFRLRSLIDRIRGSDPIGAQDASIEQPQKLTSEKTSKGAAFDLAAADQPLPIRLAQEVRNDPARCYSSMELLQRTATPSEVRQFISNLDFKCFDYLKPREYHDFSEFERTAYIGVSDLIAQVPASAISLLRAVNYIVDAQIPGAFVECGVFKGASSILMATGLRERGIEDRDIYLYDTFEGMPRPGELDVDYEGKSFMEYWDPAKLGGDSIGSSIVNSPLDEVKENFRRARYPLERAHFVKGLVEQTIPAVMPERIALLRLDTDYYQSTKHELEHLYPRLEKGGILIIDDYGHFKGARMATDEYFSARNIPIFLVRVTESVRFGVKLI